MNLCKKIWLKYQIGKFEHFLLKAGIEKAYRRGMNLKFGSRARTEVNDNIFYTICLPENEKGKIDISQLISLGTEIYSEEGKKYEVYCKMLNRLEKGLRRTFSKT